jgi:hypothetical protein
MQRHSQESHARLRVEADALAREAGLHTSRNRRIPATRPFLCLDMPGAGVEARAGMSMTYGLVM